MAPYVYESLEAVPGCLRFLILAPGQRYENVRCELRLERLDSKPKYEALSYVWGNPKSTRAITLHGHTHQVTTNLESALRHLRLPDRNRVLWVDALCINQKDLKERENQVKNMASVYIQAESVISWLGEAADDSDEAIELIRNFGPLAQKYLHKDIPEHFIDHWNTLHWHDFFTNVLGFEMEEQKWIALWKLLDRPYWTRIWMVHELVGGGLFKQSRTHLVCGMASVEKSLFDYLQMLIVTMAGTNVTRVMEGHTAIEPDQTFKLLGHPRAFVMAEATVECAFGPRIGRGLDHLIKATKRFRATDKRDMIYAIVGMAPERYHAFPPDYSKPLRNVLMDFVKFMIETDGNLNILQGNRFQVKRVEPTWTPELMQPEHGWVPGACQLSPAGESKPLVFFDNVDSDGILRVRGVTVGRVKTVIGPEKLPEKGIAPYPTGKEKDVSSYTLGIRTFAKSLKTSAEQETLWRTLVLNHNFQTTKATYPAPDEFGQMAGILLFGKPLPQDFRAGEDFEQRVLTYVAPFKKSWERMRWNRCFFTTEEGRMGAGPFQIQPGDYVVMLYGGGDFLFALREEGDHFKLIGDAYVHGFMHGELLEGVASEDQRDFSLC